MPRQMRPLSQRLRKLTLKQRKQSAESSEPSTPPFVLNDDHAQLLDYIKSHDTIALAKTKSRLAKLTTETHHLTSLVRNQILPPATKIQLNRTIPAYTPSFWRKHSNEITRGTGLFLQHAKRIEANLSDLEVILYPADAAASGTGSNQASQDPDAFEAQPLPQKVELLRELRHALEVQMKRFRVSLMQYETDVEMWMEDAIRTTDEMLLQRGSAENPSSRGYRGRGDVFVGRRRSAGGYSANPFTARRSGGMSEMGSSARIGWTEKMAKGGNEAKPWGASDVEAKEKTTAKAKDEKPAARKPTNLGDMQAQLEAVMNK